MKCRTHVTNVRVNWFIKFHKKKCELIFYVKGNNSLGFMFLM